MKQQGISWRKIPHLQKFITRVTNSKHLSRHTLKLVFPKDLQQPKRKLHTNKFCSFIVRANATTRDVRVYTTYKRAAGKADEIPHAWVILQKRLHAFTIQSIIRRIPQLKTFRGQVDRWLNQVFPGKFPVFLPGGMKTSDFTRYSHGGTSCETSVQNV